MVTWVATKLMPQKITRLFRLLSPPTKNATASHLYSGKKSPMALHIPTPPLHQNSRLSLHACSNAAACIVSKSTKTLWQFHGKVCVQAGSNGRVGLACRARRRVRYDEEDEEGDGEYGNNSEIATLEAYSERQRKEALLVKAAVDGEEELVLIFRVIKNYANFSEISLGIASIIYQNPPHTI